MRWSGVLVASAFGLAASAGALAKPTSKPFKPTVTPAPKPTVQSAVIVRSKVEVVERRPHDAASFTEGLAVTGGRVFESSGLYGTSSIREVDPKTGRVKAQQPLDASLFAEGLALRPDGKLVQLTWKEHVAIVWDPKGLREVQRIPFDGEGWGLCYDQPRKRMIHSDGTATLSFRDSFTLKRTGSVAVTMNGQPVTQINELECVGERVFANVWQTDQIIEIDIKTGSVVGTVDASGLRPADAVPDAVLNGIARLPGNTWLLTGKLWPQAYVVRFVAG
jgi:glutaminyl-peptide cyclotransferase